MCASGLGQRCPALDYAPTDLRCAGYKPSIATSIAQCGASTPAAPPLQVMRRPRVAEAVRGTRGPHGRHDPHPSCTVCRPAVRQPSMPPSTFMTWERPWCWSKLARAEERYPLPQMTATGRSLATSSFRAGSSAPVMNRASAIWPSPETLWWRRATGSYPNSPARQRRSGGACRRARSETNCCTCRCKSCRRNSPFGAVVISGSPRGDLRAGSPDVEALGRLSLGSV